MNQKSNRHMVRIILISLLILTFVLGIEAVAAHSHSGYLYFDRTIGYSNQGWMGELPDEMPISMLSIPGTHDTMADEMSANCTIKFLEMVTQSMGLKEQLDAGIRVLDIRAHHIQDVFTIHHGSCYVNAKFGSDVMEVVIDWLNEHPTETVLMRVKEEEDAESCTRSFRETFQSYLNNYDNGIVWKGTNPNPTLGEIRGKIVILDDFSSDLEEPFGPRWASFTIQDEFKLTAIWDLYDKWTAVKNHLEEAAEGPKSITHVNFLSGTGGFSLDVLYHAYPYRVASGHLEPSTVGPRLSTLLLDPPISDYPDFPRLLCVDILFEKVCTIHYEGTNVLTTNLLNDEDWTGGKKRRVGIVMADFPGAGLIDSVIAMNPWNLPPVADAGGPYTVDEATSIIVDASASYDPDGDPLLYRWLFESEEFDDLVTSWSSDPSLTNTWYDDWSGTATIEISDGYFVSKSSTTLTVSNVAPIVTALGGDIDENGIATVSGTITDPSHLDSFEVKIDWGDGESQSFDYLPGSTTFSEEHKYLDDDPTGTSSDVYTIEVTVTDDDGGAGSAMTAVTVNNLDPLVSIEHITDETGEEIGAGLRVALMHTRIDFQASFTDVGTKDTHSATINWGDGNGTIHLGSTTGTVSTSHVYTVPGVFTARLEITDDDTGMGSAVTLITVVDSAAALEVVIEQLQELANDPGLDPAAVGAVNDAIDHLHGQKDGSAADGALDFLAKNNLDTALVKMWQAMQALQAAETAGASQDLISIKNLLALAAKSTAMTAIVEAESFAAKRNELRKIADAYDLVADGDALLAGQNYIDAVNKYREATQEAQGIVNFT